MINTTLCYIECDGKYLMLHRNKKENDLNEGKWVGVGGKFEAGETPEECLLREVYEETGFTLTDYKLRGIVKFESDKWDSELMFLYSATEFVGELQECEEGEFAWIDRTKVSHLPIWQGDIFIFDALNNEKDFFIMEVRYKGDTLVNSPKCISSPLGDLFQIQDKEYRDFQAKLVPSISRESIIGVRIPKLRKYASKYKRSIQSTDFLEYLPHFFYDEYLLHGILISEEKDYEKCVKELDSLLPYVDNWAVCDTISPKVFKKNRARLFAEIKRWSSSKHEYTCRFGLKMLMTHFLDEDFNKEYLEIPAGINLDYYYVKMMVAWYYATALAKQWEATIPYLESKRLDPWTHNKTIQKAVESFRISKEQKEYLKSLKQDSNQSVY